MATAEPSQDSAAPVPDERYTSAEELWDDGAYIVRSLKELRGLYDGYIRTANQVDDGMFSKEEARAYRRDIIYTLTPFIDDGGSPSLKQLYRQLDTAYRAAISFTAADAETRLQYRSQNPERYGFLVEASPAEIHVDTEPLMDEFNPKGGVLHRLTARIVQNGVSVLDEWVESSEDIHARLEEEREPATTPEDREGHADRAYQ